MTAHHQLSAPLPVTSGHSSEQGTRPTMEDEILMKDSFHIPSRGYFSFFGVFDGHGGRSAAEFTRDHLFNLLVAELTAGVEPSLALTRAYIETDQRFIQSTRGSSGNGTSEGAAVEGEQDKSGDVNMDITATAASAGSVNKNATTSLPPSSQHKRQHSTGSHPHLAVKIPAASLPPAASTSRSSSTGSITATAADNLALNDTSGTTAVSVLIHHDTYTVYVGNVGDSRAVLSSAGETCTALTNDQKADRPDEVDRIRRAGGFVVHKRVMGELAISRAIGDAEFKEVGFQFVLPDPELAVRPLNEKDEFLLMACDGIYDVMSNEQACTFIRTSLAGGASIHRTSELLVRHALDTLNTRDNVTVIIIKLPTKQELTAAGLAPVLEANAKAIVDSAAMAASSNNNANPQQKHASVTIRDSHVQTPVAVAPASLQSDSTIQIEQGAASAASSNAVKQQAHRKLSSRSISGSMSSGERDNDGDIQFHSEVEEEDI